MKISARTCKTPAAPVTQPEPDLEFYLQDDPSNVYLRVMDKNTGDNSGNYVLAIDKKTGRLRRIKAVSKSFGLPLNFLGQLKLNTED